jgi:hypothetical protein
MDELVVVLPYCTSGNHYLSLEQGGEWIDTGIHPEPYYLEQLWDSFHPWFLCYKQTGYSNTYQWKPPCRPLPSPF